MVIRLKPANKVIPGSNRTVRRRVREAEVFAVKLARWHVLMPTEADSTPKTRAPRAASRSKSSISATRPRARQSSPGGPQDRVALR